VGVLIREGTDKLGQNSVYAAMIIASQVVGAFLGCLLSCLSQSFNNGLVSPGIALLCPPNIND
jgi:hypothetical protein